MNSDAEFHDDAAGDAAPAVSQPARRRLLRGGLGAAPVILTLASQPVLAGQCTKASASTSAGSRSRASASTCTGQKPSYWASEISYSQWPSAIRPTATAKKAATTFGEVFKGTSTFSEKTMLTVLKTTGSGNEDVARHLIAALFNANMGTTNQVLDATTVMTIWDSYRRYGYYRPTGGIVWYYDRSVPPGNGNLIDWLRSTMV